MIGKDGGGLWSAMTYGGRIRADAWDRAVSTGEVIGTCTLCHEYIVPDDVAWSEGSEIGWFTARCLGCGHKFAAPGGRVRKHVERGRDGRAV